MGRKGKSSQDIMRRFQQGSARKAADAERTRAEMARELEDPGNFSRCLAVFGQLALLLEPLYACRFPSPEFIPAAVRAAEGCALEPGPERFAAVRRTVVEELASLERLTTCQEAIQRAIQGVEDRDALLGLTAGGALASSCAQADARADHPFWEVLFQISLTEAVLSGHLLTYLVLEQVPQDPEAIQSAFARALAQDEIGRTLAELGVGELKAGELCEGYLNALADPYHLQLDAVLHLVWTHVEVASGMGSRLANEGLPGALLEEMISSWRAAFERDVDAGLIRELRGWCKSRLEGLRDDPEGMAETYASRGLEAERLRAASTLLALEALEPGEDALLQAVHVQSLQRSRVAPSELERGFVEKLWGQPTDLFALEEYERFLLSRGEANRSRRVHRFREWVRAQPAPASPPQEAEASGGE